VVRTDHAALTDLRNFEDHNGRLLRCCLTLSELDFVVEHKPGSNIAHADALSRHFGSLAQKLSRQRDLARANE
jgi:hypothetical protein